MAAICAVCQCIKLNARSRDAYGFATTGELQFGRCCAQEICCLPGFSTFFVP